MSSGWKWILYFTLRTNEDCGWRSGKNSKTNVNFVLVKYHCPTNQPPPFFDNLLVAKIMNGYSNCRQVVQLTCPCLFESLNIRWIGPYPLSAFLDFLIRFELIKFHFWFYLIIVFFFVFFLAMEIFVFIFFFHTY